jgi:hypothetical protein
MPAHGVRTIKGKEPQLRKLLYELRYEHGYVYLDRCGRILDRISREMPEWLPAGDANPQGANLYNVRNRCSFSFSARRLGLSLDHSSPPSALIDDPLRSDFVRTAADMSGFIIQELELDTFARIGARSVFQFSTSSENESHDWLAGLGLYSVSLQFMRAFDTDRAAADLTAVFVGQDCRYRIEASAVESVVQLDMGAGQALGVREKSLPAEQRKAFQQSKIKSKRERDLNTGYAVQIDVDAYHEFPVSPNIPAFLSANTEGILDRIRKAIDGSQ